jgi:DNA-binding response OmpR family regulator
VSNEVVEAAYSSSRGQAPIQALVVTEDERLGMMLARALERHGALRVSRARPATAVDQARLEGVDVVLLDLTPGTNFDPDLSSRLAARAPVILLCSYLTSQERERARAAGVTAIHLKRIGVEDLRRHIAAVCAAS